MNSSAAVVVTGANGLVGARVCEALSERGEPVRAVVRRAGTAPSGPAIEEVVGDFTDPGFAAAVLSGASSAVTTVHPMGSDRATQHRIGVQGTRTFVRAAASAGVERSIHISTSAVYERSSGIADITEESALIGDDAGDYAVTKRDTDLALTEVGGITRVLLRPPAILGPGPTSVWNAHRPAAMREHESARRAVAEETFAWVHVGDLASLAAELATGRITDAADPANGPVAGECVALNVTAARATQREYVEAVTGALGVDPIWIEEPTWTGTLLNRRAHSWGWTATVDLEDALAELVAGLSAGS